MPQKLIIFVVSPLSGHGNPIREHTNLERAKRICREIVLRSNNDVLYIPFAPHVYFTQFLYENKDAATERELGISCGTEMLKHCDEVWVFTEEGQESTGMKAEIEEARRLNRTVKYPQQHGLTLGL